jgi:serine/threonine protein kinase/tetratricopeptide (TPR) repeat protein
VAREESTLWAQTTYEVSRPLIRSFMSAESLPPPPTPSAGDVSLARGATIGRYVVLGPVGRGAMGEVYAAYDPELDRKVAIKLLRAKGGASRLDGRARLLREAQAIARLSHPNVVVVYDVGTFEESVFVAMEFVQGHTVAYWLHAEQRRWRDVLNVFMAAGRGLAAAHEAGLVHRDFKPENVMITKGGQVRVMDFGLARETMKEEPVPLVAHEVHVAARATLAATIDPEVDADATLQLNQTRAPATTPPSGSSGGYLGLKLTQTGALLGTPAYMAPEQFAGITADARTDQFAFAVALYEALYGHRPFAGADVRALMTNVMTGTTVEPPENAQAPGWIRKVLLRSLSTRLDDRFPTMAELLAVLEQDPAARRRRWAAVTAGVICVAVVTVAALRASTGQSTMCAGGPARAATAWNPARRNAIEQAFTATGHKHAAQAFATAASQLDGYIARWSGMYREACEATQVHGVQSPEVLDLRMGCLDERLSSVRALSDVLAVADRGVVDNAVSAVGALPSPDRCADVGMLRAVIRPPDNAAMHAKVATLQESVAKVNALASAGRCDQATKVGAPVLAAAKTLGYKPLEAEIGYALGSLFDTCLDPKEAIADLEDAVLAAEASRHDEVAIEASAMLGSAYANLTHDVRLGRHWIRMAEAISARLPGQPLLEARVASCRAVVLYREGKLEDSLREEKHVLAIRASAFGPTSNEVAMSHNNVAIMLHELGRDEEAATSIRRAIEIFGSVLGDDTGRVALASLNECEIHTALGRFDTARTAIKNALRIWREQGASPFYVGLGLLDQGKLELAEHNSRAAASSLEASLTLIGQEDPQQAADVRFSLARALLASSNGNRDRAADLARDALATIAAEPTASGLARKIEAWQKEQRLPSKSGARL